jgi:outer membrane protein OmpA-like peptidoglycan-associated protein
LHKQAKPNTQKAIRPLIIGVLLFLIWSALSTWFFISKLYPISDSPIEAALTEEAIPLPESPSATPILPDKPGDITLYFDYNKAIVKALNTLDDFLTKSDEYLKVDTAACLIITGHTCSIGSEKYNLELGMKRALAVQNYLRGKGFTNHCFKVYSKGEKEPAQNNSTEEGRIKNRRVELTIN